MGIKGLTNYIKSKRPPCIEKLDMKVLHFDGNGLMWHILDKIKMNRTLGGDYSSYACQVEEYISIFTSRCKKIIIYFDGKYRRMKSKEDGKRREERENEYMLMWDWLSEGATNKIPDMDDRPLPVLIKTQLRKTLENMKYVEILDCEEEADQEIAKAAQNRASNVM